jgi:uncharacterized membrane-anchored protein
MTYKRLLARPVAAILTSGALMSLVLLYMVVDRVRLLSGGREIVLPIRPVDPRDLFKGDYARLGFDISRLEPAMMAAISSAPEPRWRKPEAPLTVYVTLSQQADGAWKPTAVSPSLPAALGKDQIALKGRTRPYDRQAIGYGIERYFVPEGTGTRIEDLARTSTLSAIIAVDRAGRAAIKGLVIEGKRVYEEPLL